MFVLGFPMGLVAAARQYVICRTGAIARIRDYLEDKTKDFLVDATVFPGNSGGPVVFCPSALAITGTKPIQRADLIGVVKSYESRASHSATRGAVITGASPGVVRSELLTFRVPQTTVCDTSHPRVVAEAA